MPFTKILVAYDGSNLSQKALKKAVQLTEESTPVGSQAPAPSLEIVHVFQYPTVAGNVYVVDSKAEYLEYAKATIEAAKQFVPPRLPVKYNLLSGAPGPAVLDYAEKNGCDLIVTGSRGLGPIREFFLGSVSHTIVQNAKIPVLIVK